MAADGNPYGNPNGSNRSSGFHGAGNGSNSNGYLANGGMDNSGPSQPLKHNPGLSMEWSVEEQRILEEALCRYATESTIVRYAKIAMLLQDKTVRDVALRCRWMSKKESCKRRKDQHLARKNKDRKEKAMGHSARSLANATARSSAPPYAAPTLPADSNDGIFFQAIGGATGQLLEQNAQVFDQISANLTTFQIQENINLFYRTRNNILMILNELKDMPGLTRQMPALPVKLNEELANSVLPWPSILTQS